METSLAHINGALWVIAALFILATAALLFTLGVLIKIMLNILNMVREVKDYSKKLVDKIDPLADTASQTLKDISKVAAGINESVSKFASIAGSIASFFSCFGIIGSLLPVGKKKGFISGIISGLNIWSALKKQKSNKKEGE